MSEQEQVKRESDFADIPESTRYELKGGKFVTLKNFLSGYDDKKIQSAGITAVRAQDDPEAKPSIEIDPVKLAFARLDAYIKGWNLSNREGKQLVVSSANIRNLSRARLAEIEQVLDRHVAAMGAEGNETGDAPSGDPSPSSAN
jgi:hypothetical protein